MDKNVPEYWDEDLPEDGNYKKWIEEGIRQAGVVEPDDDYIPPPQEVLDVDLVQRTVKKYRHKKGFTLIHKMRTVYSVKVHKKTRAARRFYGDLCKTGLHLEKGTIIYIIAITGEDDEIKIDYKKMESDQDIHITEEFKSKYKYADWLTGQGLVGHWEVDGVGVLDACVALQFIKEEEAHEFAKKHEQETILRIGPDGRCDELVVR